MKDHLLIHEDNFDKARKLIKENPEKNIIFFSNDDELNRKILEKEKISILLLSQKGRKDFHRQRNSGLNQVMAKLAKKNDVAVGINLDEIIISEGKKKAEILARIIQNIRICNKNRLKMKFIALDKNNERNIFDLKSLGLVLGMPTWMTKEL
jgi:ribonuclease P/MRP protein subunit RPP1